MTSSAAGLYGNFGQANYSAGKLVFCVCVCSFFFISSHSPPYISLFFFSHSLCLSVCFLLYFCPLPLHISISFCFFISFWLTLSFSLFLSFSFSLYLLFFFSASFSPSLFQSFMLSLSPSIPFSIFPFLFSASLSSFPPLSLSLSPFCFFCPIYLSLSLLFSFSASPLFSLFLPRPSLFLSAFLSTFASLSLSLIYLFLSLPSF